MGQEYKEQYEAAHKLQKDGNFKDAYEKFTKIIIDENVPVEWANHALERSQECLINLEGYEEIDLLIQKFIKPRQKNWQAYKFAGLAYSRVNHGGHIVNGKFKRGYYHHRFRAPWVDSVEYDRNLAISYFEKAMSLLPEDLNPSTKAGFYLNFSHRIMESRHRNRSWKLQSLTDTKNPPDLTQAQYHGYRSHYSNSSNAPVDSDGNPFYYAIPDSYETAANDGERWRWLLSQAAKFEKIYGKTVDFLYARFLHDQFGVQTLRDYGWYFNKLSSESESSVLSFDKLNDNQTIAKLATGIKKFILPDEHNYIAIYKSLIQRGDQGSYHQLANVYLNRRQFEKAEEVLKSFLEKWPDDRSVQNQLKQITGNWGEVSSVNSPYKGKNPGFDFRFRNGSKVTFRASKVNLKKIFRERIAYFETKPQRLNYQKSSIYPYGLINEIIQSGDKYLTGEVETWQEKLTPANNHANKRVTLQAPIKRSGVWLLKSTMESGNTSHCLIQIEGDIIVKKQLDKKVLIYLTDGVTGKPLVDKTVQFFGYGREYTKNPILGGDYYKYHIKDFERVTDKQGKILLDEGDFYEDKIGKQWFISYENGAEFSFLSNTSLYNSQLYDHGYQRKKSYILTDRPVYQPGQKVEIKAWTAEVSYDSRRQQVHQGVTHVEIYDPRGKKIFSYNGDTDEWGGTSGTFVIPETAKLGNYRISTSWGNYSFRVEEYKKPEFEVTVETAPEAVALGEKIPVTVKANYYFGAPVNQAKVKLKVHRYEHHADWFPAGEWDWLYGSGYIWPNIDSEWYPGWYHWGCKMPRHFWLPRNPPIPELVIELEGQLNESGTYSFEVDSSIAKEMYGDKSQRYEVTAEVTDKSRRTIVGKGDVVAAREPFKTYVWSDRSYYNTGDKININFQTRTPSGKNVTGEATLKFYRVTYDGEGKSEEKLIESTTIKTNDSGRGKWRLGAAKAGQYRVSCTITTKEGVEQEGAVLFSIYGEDSQTESYRYNQLELLTDKQLYQPGEKLQLRINSSQENATILVFVRSMNGVCPLPKVMRLDGKSADHEIVITENDQPNFFIEALTVFEGKVHTMIKEVFVPPEDKALKVEVIPDKDDFRPGKEAQLKVKITGPDGEPAQGTFALSVYDKALEYIAGNNQRSEIRSFFWSWKRQHHPRTQSSILRYFYAPYYQDQKHRMLQLGVFGNVGENVLHMKESLGGTRSAQQDLRMDSKKESSKTNLDRVSSFKQKSKKPRSGMAVPKIRKNFVDSAFWQANVTTDSEGKAKVKFTMPENLTAWKIRCWGVSKGFTVGEGETSVTTSKKLLLRLQAPRFFVEKDEVVISANVHNYLADEKTVKVELKPNALIEAVGQLTQTVKIKAGGEQRIDWRVKVLGEGEVKLQAFAYSDEESDAVEMKFPAKVHGQQKMDSFSAYLAPDKSSTTLMMNLPEKLDPDATRLELRYSPTLAASMVDALPYLVDFPYGCTEQTLNRFLPTTITRNILQEMKVDLGDIENKLTNLNSQQIGNDRVRAEYWQAMRKNPVFSAAKIKQMEAVGVQRLQEMQCPDGGWGWFSGYYERSSAHTTAYVVQGLLTAQENGVEVNNSVLKRGLDWLADYQQQEAIKIRNYRNEKTDVPLKNYADNLDALVYYTLLRGDRSNEEMMGYLYKDRNKLAVYGKALLALALHIQGEDSKVNMLKGNIEQFLKLDDENQTAYLETQNGGYWWYWYGSDNEAHAYYLKLLTRVDPNGKIAPMLVKYLVNNRQNGHYWKSTRDTALCIEAMADYLRTTGEMSPEMTVEILVNNEKHKEVQINHDNLFSFDNKLILDSAKLGPGEHKVEVRRQGQGPLYVNAYLSYFSKEDYIKKAGLEIKVERKYYKLMRKEATQLRPGKRGQIEKADQENYERLPVTDMSKLKSGDLVEVDLEIISKNDYEYIAFEDLKAAGFEAIEIRSGYRRIGGFYAYQEMRHDRVAFFVTRLPRGTHNLSYRLRAEIPGKFSALPAKAYANYAPELRGNSDELKVQIED